MARVPARPGWHLLLTPRWLGWRAFTVVGVFGMLWLGDWQFHRAESGNALSWAYTFEWPVFAVLGVIFWAKTIRDEFKPPADPGEAEDVDLPPGAAAGTGPGGRPGARGGPHAAEEDDPELAARDAHPARLNHHGQRHRR